MWSLVLGEVSVSCAIVVIGSLRFARWLIEREDRLAVERALLTPEIRRARRVMLIGKREIHVELMNDWSRRGYEKDSETHRQLIDKIDRELCLLGATS